MNRFGSIRKSAFCFACILLLAGCGGGGSGRSEDSSFDSGTGFDGIVRAIAPATDGSGDIYVGGLFTAYNGNARNRIIRVNDDGSIDTVFDPGTGFDSSVLTIAPAIDGNDYVYAGGIFTDYNGNARARIARVNGDGTNDGAFDTGTGFNNFVIAIAPATDGSGDIYAGGDFSLYRGIARNSIARVNSDGTNDGTFDPGTGFNDRVLAIALAADGSGDIYVGGAFTDYNGNARNRIVRINNDGSIDGAFDTGSGFNNFLLALASATDGSGDVYAGGGFSIYRGNARNRIARVNSDSSNDGAFNPGTGINSNVNTIAPAADGSGDIYVGGAFTVYNGNARSRIIRINDDGSIDTGFDPGAGFNNTVWSIAPATDGSGDIYVGGEFTTYRGLTANRIIRLDSTGAPN